MTEQSNADVGPADCHAVLIGHICRFAPEVSSVISRAVNVRPAYSRPATLALVVLYERYHIYAPLFCLSLLKHGVDDNDDDDRKTMTMLAPELAEGSPFRDMSAVDLLKEILKGLQLMVCGFQKRNSELDEEMKSFQRRRRFWIIVLSVVYVVILLAILAGVKAAITTGIVAGNAAAALIFSVMVANLPGVFAMYGVFSLLGVTDFDRERLWENRKAVRAMMIGTLFAATLPCELEHIRTRLLDLNIERSALRTAVASERQVDQGGSLHFEREEIQKEKKRIHEGVNRAQCEVKKAAADFADIIAN